MPAPPNNEPKKPYLTERELRRIVKRANTLYRVYKWSGGTELIQLLDVDVPRLIDELRDTLETLDDLLYYAPDPVAHKTRKRIKP